MASVSVSVNVISYSKTGGSGKEARLTGRDTVIDISMS